MIVAGLHVPAMPFVDVVGNAGAVLLWQIGPIAVKVGPTCDAITMFIVVVVPHWPADGVKVWVVVPTVAVLIVAGLQVPVTPLVDVVGNAGATLLLHSGAI